MSRNPPACIPTEPVGSLPRPSWLQRAYAQYDAGRSPATSSRPSRTRRSGTRSSTRRRPGRRSSPTASSAGRVSRPTRFSPFSIDEKPNHGSPRGRHRSGAVPGTHGSGILAIKDQLLGTGAAEAAMALYDGGVRHLLLDGGRDAVGPFLASGLVDHVVAYMPYRSASRRPASGLAWPLLPPGFVVASVVKTESFVRVDGERDASR